MVVVAASIGYLLNVRPDELKGPFGAFQSTSLIWSIVCWSGPAAPPQQWQPQPATPTQQPPAKKGAGGGITPVGLISLLAIFMLMLGAAYVGNRIQPINPGIDSAWRGTDGNAKELTSFLRCEGYTCSDEGTATGSHFHRLCAQFDETSKLAIEFAGPTSGEIMRVHVQPQGALTPDGVAAATRAIELSVPDQTAQRAARSALSAGPNSTDEVSGPWGKAGWADDTFTVARNWAGPDLGTFTPGSITGVREQAAERRAHDRRLEARLHRGASARTSWRPVRIDPQRARFRFAPAFRGNGTLAGVAAEIAIRIFPTER